MITNRKTDSIFLFFRKYIYEGLITDTDNNHVNTPGIL